MHLMYFLKKSLCDGPTYGLTKNPYWASWPIKSICPNEPYIYKTAPPLPHLPPSSYHRRPSILSPSSTSPPALISLLPRCRPILHRHNRIVSLRSPLTHGKEQRRCEVRWLRPQDYAAATAADSRGSEAVGLLLSPRDGGRRQGEIWHLCHSSTSVMVNA